MQKLHRDCRKNLPSACKNNLRAKQVYQHLLLHLEFNSSSRVQFSAFLMHFLQMDSASRDSRPKVIWCWIDKLTHKNVFVPTKTLALETWSP